MGERLVCNQEAIGSIPFTSTILRSKSGGRPEVLRSVGAEGNARSVAGQLNELRMACHFRSKSEGVLKFLDLGAKVRAPAL